jgi:hypothetical protein
VKRFFLATAVCVLLGSAVQAQPPGYLPGVPGLPAPTAPTEDPRAPFFSPEIKKSFPHLGSDFRVLALASKRYNAYSFVLGFTDRWLVPEKGTLDNPLAGADRFLAQSGYRRVSGFDLRVEPGKQKVVVYATVAPDGSIAAVQSMALQQTDGSWACKVGSMGVIAVRSPAALRGPTYGLVVAVYVRDTTPSYLPGPR